jgi:hypothetical protein
MTALRSGSKCTGHFEYLPATGGLTSRRPTPLVLAKLQRRRKTAHNSHLWVETAYPDGFPEGLHFAPFRPQLFEEMPDMFGRCYSCFPPIQL